MNVVKLADTIAHDIEYTSLFLKQNWKSIAALAWMLLATNIMIQQEKELEETTYQLANMNMTVSDIRHSLSAAEKNMNKMAEETARLHAAVQKD